MAEKCIHSQQSENSSTKHIDVLIVGGGLIGLSLYLALSASGYNIKLIETQPFADLAHDPLDPRTLALSPASRQILTMLKVWPHIASHISSIKTIHISEQRTFGSARLKARAEEDLGYVIEISLLLAAMRHLVNPKDIIAPAKLTAIDTETGWVEIESGQEKSAFKASIIIAGDGTQSSIRELTATPVSINDYHHHAISATIALARNHQNIAYERFTPNGPIAFLPLAHQRAALIWSLPPKDVERVLKLQDAEFLSTLQDTFGYRLGKFIAAGKRMSFPLKQVITEQKIIGRVAFIGNASQTLHPVAGQGFNLGLRDVAMLAQCLIQEGLSSPTLKYYQQQREADQRNICVFTHSLIQLFSAKHLGIRMLRHLGLLLFDNLAFAKNLLIRHASGYGGVIPDLVCAIPLQTSQPAMSSAILSNGATYARDS